MQFLRKIAQRIVKQNFTPVDDQLPLICQAWDAFQEAYTKYGEGARTENVFSGLIHTFQSAKNVNFPAEIDALRQIYSENKTITWRGMSINSHHFILTLVDRVHTQHNILNVDTIQKISQLTPIEHMIAVAATPLPDGTSSSPTNGQVVETWKKLVKDSKGYRPHPNYSNSEPILSTQISIVEGVWERFKNAFKGKSGSTSPDAVLLAYINSIQGSTADANYHIEVIKLREIINSNETIMGYGMTFDSGNFGLKLIELIDNAYPNQLQPNLQIIDNLSAIERLIAEASTPLSFDGQRPDPLAVLETRNKLVEQCLPKSCIGHITTSDPEVDEELTLLKKHLEQEMG